MAYKVSARRRAELTRRLLNRLIKLQNNPALEYLEKARQLMGYSDDPTKIREADNYLEKVWRINQRVSEERSRIESALKDLKAGNETKALWLLTEPLPKLE